MKKLLLAISGLTLCHHSFADEFKFQPSEKEQEAFKLIVRDDIMTTLAGGEGLYQFPDLIQVTPEELQKEYANNEVRADKKFRDKKLSLKGVVGKIQSDATNKPFITFKLKNVFQSPQAKFDSKDEDKAIDLNKGDKVHVLCVGAGEIVGTPILHNCRTADSFADEELATFMTEYDKIKNGESADKNYFVAQNIYRVAALSYATNDFAKCASGKINIQCLEKSLDKTAKEQFKKIKSGDIPENLKSLAAYLGIAPNLDK